MAHTIDWALGGTTCPANLMPLCTRRHHLKHDAGRRLQRLADDTVRWTTPTGHTYDRPPPDSLPIDTTTDTKAETDVEIDDHPPPF